MGRKELNQTNKQTCVTVQCAPSKHITLDPCWSSAGFGLKFTSFCVNNLSTVLFRVLKIKINLVKLIFWTAISSHQVMGMSLTKVWVMYCIVYMSIQTKCLKFNMTLDHDCAFIWCLKYLFIRFNCQCKYQALIWECHRAS